MQKADFKKLKLPDSPGVYFFLGPRKKILYIGKATSLRNRVRSYAASDLVEKRSEIIERMVAEATKIEVTETDSVLEALILETNLIRTHKPPYNTRSKDDKSYNHLIITKEQWPRVLIVRGKDLRTSYTKSDLLYEIGPFPSGKTFREAMKIIRKLFQFYDTKRPVGNERGALEKGKINFNRQIGLYPEKNSARKYQQTIRHIKLFFQGKKSEIIDELTEEMMELAANEHFEEAAAIKRQIFALNHIQDIALLKNENVRYQDEKTVRIEAYDIAHLQGRDMVGVMTVLEGSEPVTSEYRKFKIKSVEKANDTAALKEIITRRLTHDDWPLPNIIVMDGSTAQKNAAEQILRKHKLVIPVVAVVKNERHKPVRMIGQKAILDRHKQALLLANAEAHRFAITYHRKKRSQHLH